MIARLSCGHDRLMLPGERWYEDTTFCRVCPLTPTRDPASYETAVVKVQFEHGQHWVFDWEEDDWYLRASRY